MKRSIKSWFTLVELIVVITILAILWTIAFISFQWYSRNARDWVRTSDITNITKALELYISEKWSYPLPSNFVSILYSWATVWNQWNVWDSLITNIQTINKKPLDPVFSNEYTYSVNSFKNEFQLWSILEWDSVSSNFLINKTYASLDLPITYIKWNYNWKILIANTWWYDYVFSVPSILSSDLSSTQLLDIVNNNKLIYNWFIWYPSSYSWFIPTSKNDFKYLASWASLLAFTWKLSVDLYWEWIFKLVDKIHAAYSWSAIQDYNTDIWTDKSNTALYTWEIVKKIYWLPKLNTLTSCEQVYNAWKSEWDWYYHFFSLNYKSVYETYCDMSNWWWTLLFSVNPAWTIWKYDSIQWTKPTLTPNMSSLNILNDEMTSWAYWELITNKIKICRWNFTNCYTINHNQNRTLKSFYNLWDNYIDYSRCLPSADCTASPFPIDIWDIAIKTSFLSLMWVWSPWNPKQWFWINVSMKNKLWIQFDHNNIWPDFDNEWYWIWVFRSHNCWRNWTFIDNTRARSVEWNTTCAYTNPDTQIWYVFAQ